MSNSRQLRILIFAFVSVISVVGLVACYKVTGKELIMTKTASPSTVKQAGQVITYTYEVFSYVKENTGNYLPMMTITITDSPLDGPVVCSKTTLTDHDWVTCTATYTVTEVDIANGGVTNTALVTGRFTIAGVTHTATDTTSAFVSANDGDSSSAVEPTSADVPPLLPLAPTAGVSGPKGMLAPTNVPSVLALPTPKDVPPLLALPILTGDVTFCDPSTRIINLRFVPGFDPQNFNHQVTMGGVVMICEVNPSNKTLISCKYPQSAVFPAAIQVTLNGVIVNEFVFGGGICAEPDQSSKPNDNDTGPVCVPLPGMVCP